MEIRGAYETLSDKTKREQYDKYLKFIEVVVYGNAKQEQAHQSQEQQFFNAEFRALLLDLLVFFGKALLMAYLTQWALCYLSGACFVL